MSYATFTTLTAFTKLSQVTVFFVDYTVLTMRTAPFGLNQAKAMFGKESNWLLCDILFPDGRTVTVRSSCPVGAEGYVHFALQFKHWAERSPDSRRREAEQLATEQEEVFALT